MITRNSFEGAYPVVRLGEVANFLDNKRRPVTESDRKPGPYPYYGANGIQGNIDSYIFDEPLVLLAEDGGHFDDPERGIAYAISGKTWVNNHAHVLQPKSKIELKFLCRVLENYDVKPFVTGTTRGKLTKAGAAEIPIPLPPIDEQRRIAAILDQADAIRAKRRESLAQLDSLTQSIFAEMFGDSVTNPMAWPLASIDKVCDLIMDCVNRTAPVLDGPSPYKMIRTTNVRGGKVNLSQVRYVTEATFNKWNRRATPIDGDVLLTREAPLGEAGILEGNEKVFLGQRLMLYRANKQWIEPTYLLASFRSKFLRAQFAIHGSGSTVKHLSIPACRSFQLFLPPINIQRTFAQRVDAIEELKNLQFHSFDEVNTLFESLQHRAFQGEL